MPKISIGITVHNGKNYIIPCLKSIYESTEESLEVIVFDDGSSDGTGDAIQKQFPQVKLLRSSENIGTAMGRRKVLENYTGKFFLRLDADTEVAPDAITTMAAFLEDNPDIGVVGPKIIDPQGNIDFTSFGTHKIAAWQTFKDYSFVVWKFYRKLKDMNVPRRLPTEPIRVDHLLGAAFMVRREAIEEAGLPRTDVTHYREETDWLYTIANCGWEIWFNPQATVMHIGGSTSSLNESIYIHGHPKRMRDMWHFVDHHYPGLINRIRFYISIVSGSVVSLLFGVLLLPFVFHTKVRKVFFKIMKTFGAVLFWHLRHYSIMFEEQQ